MRTVGKTESQLTDVEIEIEEMYRANVRLVYSFARARLGDDDGADLTSEVFRDTSADGQRSRWG